MKSSARSFAPAADLRRGQQARTSKETHCPEKWMLQPFETCLEGRLDKQNRLQKRCWRGAYDSFFFAVGALSDAWVRCRLMSSNRSRIRFSMPSFVGS